MIDYRHQHRIDIIKKLFALSFDNGKQNLENTDEDLKKILDKNNEIEKVIIKYAPRYPIERISKIDLAILRLSLFELLFDKKNPPKVIIDEAVELAKEFGNDRSYSFINGVLGSALKDITDNEK